MRLNDRRENMPRAGGDFYETREVITLSEVGPGEKKQTVESVPCITMTSMLFCKHGGLIMPLKSGQFWKEVGVQPYIRIAKVSDRLIAFLKNYEVGQKGIANQL